MATPANARFRTQGDLGGDGLYARVVDSIGQDIVNGVRKQDDLVNPDQLCQDFDVSRSVVREALRTLSSMGLVAARPRVGTRVLPRHRWDVFNPMVVHWRGRGSEYLVQHRELLELRRGVEGAAARLAAERMPASVASELLAHAVDMLTAVETGDRMRFYEADSTFHRLILEHSGNALMAKFADTVEALLHAKSIDRRPAMAVLVMASARRHVHLAQALLERNPDKAAAVVSEIVDGSLAEFDDVLEQTPSPVEVNDAPADRSDPAARV